MMKTMAQAPTLNPAPAAAPPAESGLASAPHHATSAALPQIYAMLSDPGQVRQTNEDSCGADPAHGAFAVCDGMGGAAAGEIASQLALDTFLATLAAPPGPLDCAQRLQDAVHAANRVVYRQAQRSRAQRGMGTTLVALLCDPPLASCTATTVWIAHVGDSRCYRLRAGRLEQLTRDHSLIEEQIQAGLITPGEAAASPIRNIITRAIGSYPAVEPEIASCPAQPGDLFLLASDGLTRELGDPAIATILLADLGAAHSREVSHVSLQQACQALVHAANTHGGGDNITVLLLAIR